MTTDELDDHDADPRVEAFWEVAKRRARLSIMPGYFGASPLSALPPPTWSFGADAAADEALAALVADGTLADTSPLATFDGAGEPRPAVGTLGIVTDGLGNPRALVGTTDVAVDEAGGTVTETLTVLYSED